MNYLLAAQITASLVVVWAVIAWDYLRNRKERP